MVHVSYLVVIPDVFNYELLNWYLSAKKDWCVDRIVRTKVVLTLLFTYNYFTKFSVCLALIFSCLSSVSFCKHPSAF